MIYRRHLTTLLVVLAAVAIAATACGAEGPELETSDGASGGRSLTETTDPLVVRGDAMDDDLAAAPRQTALGRSARAFAPDSGSDADVLPPLVVLDTDMGPDIDDALALAMLHTYQDRRQAEIAGVTLSRNSMLGARFVDAMNTWHGHPDIPVGIDRQSPFAMLEASSYVSLADRFSNDVAAEPIADGVDLLRQVLVRAIAEEREVLIVQVGFSGNVAALLDSRPDELSILPGSELVRRSGAVLSLMGGSFEDRVEFNVANDVVSARRVIDGWPGDLVLSPFELGYDLHYPYAAIRDRLDDDNLIRQAYEFTDYSWHVDAPSYYDMRSWDLTSVMAAIEPEDQWFPRSGFGTVTVDAEGRTFFNAGQGRHQILQRSSLSGQQLDRIRTAMVELVTASTPLN